MLGNCGTQLAVRLLTDMAIGRGSHAAMETVSVGLVETILFTSVTRNKKNNIRGLSQKFMDYCCNSFFFRKI